MNPKEQAAKLSVMSNTALVVGKLTIKERRVSASQLLKRLTSYSRKHKLYQALREFGRIIKTQFLLNYIDDVSLRQQIEKQLNKVESANKFSKAVFFW